MFQLLLVFFLAASAVNAAPSKALWQFRNIIKCTMPNSKPLEEFNRYGCYCGLGGQGNPLDELDTCCQVHDNCYNAAKQVENCSSLIHNPYTEVYAYTCSGTTVTCESDNSPCEMHVCECDRQAALCFSKASYNEDFKDVDKNKHC
ncbi:phospholipase A2, minor isoenzyme-like [Microcaecilia unicolor]|uniref:Phospholipase A2 n=1 Tax=Microcaecilia unicolor TaxID=1415580 RepID=A0A6P7Y7P8_9AMPH|nr:phospholipase A2, minor isoenzyme-like [Microcaecilia unicolor]